MIFHWGLSDIKSPRISRILLRILARLKSALIWIDSIIPLISSPSSLFSKSLGAVSRALTTIDIIVTFIFHSFFSSLTSPREYYAIYFKGQILICVYIICQYSTTPTGSPFPHSYIHSCIPFVPLFGYHELFYLYHHKTYTCYSSVYYQFLLRHYQFLRYYFVLLWLYSNQT